MNRLTTSTRGIASWRDRLRNPEGQWKRGYSAFETAVSWERATKRASGLPEPIEHWLKGCELADPNLVVAIAEHQVSVGGAGGGSHSDVWAIVDTSAGWVSLAVEAKARESFGNEILEQWLKAGTSQRSPANRAKRWSEIQKYLPPNRDYMPVRYQLLHRCAVAVKEAERLRLQNAACVIQSFDKCAVNKAAFKSFCEAVDPTGVADARIKALVGDITLYIGWVECPLANDADVAACT